MNNMWDVHNTLLLKLATAHYHRPRGCHVQLRALSCTQKKQIHLQEE
jgi:hypothetical protein